MKRLVAFLMVVVMATSFTAGACAYDDPEDHWRDIDNALFGEYLEEAQLHNISAIDALHISSAFAIDQPTSNGANKRIDFLRNYGVYGIHDFEYYKLTGNAGKHREFTHLGWNNPQTADSTPWKRRKMALLATAEKVFRFSVLPDWIDSLNHYGEKCDSFCAIVYYLHVIGDHVEIQDYATYQKKLKGSAPELLPLAGNSYQTYAIIPEIQRYLTILISNKTGHYGQLMDGLSRLNTQVNGLYRRGLNDATFNDYKNYISELQKLLNQHLPHILRNEPFFRDVFYK